MHRPHRATVVLTVLGGIIGVLLQVGAPRATAVTASPIDGSAPRYGFTAGSALVQLTPADLAAQLDAVVAAGGTWLRVPFQWSRIEPTPGAPNWTATDRVVAAADAHGLRVLGVISYAPQWARTSTEDTAPPDDPAAFGRFAGQVAERYRASVNTWEIWNEPNIKVGFGGTVDAAAYVALLKAAYGAIKKVQPLILSTVVSGGLNRGPTATGGLIAYVKQMYAAGARGSFDALGLHPYLRATTASGLVADNAALTEEIDQIRRYMGDRFDLPRLWFTEFGRPTSAGFTQTQQADLLLSQLDQYARLPLAGPSILYTIRDAGIDPANPSHNFGTLLTFDGQPKELARRLQERLAGTGVVR